MVDNAPASLAAERIRRLLALAETQSWVVSRRQAYGLGVSRGQVRAQLRARRWQRIGGQSLVLHTGPLDARARLWAAVFEGGPRAQLDGASALIAAGLEQYREDRIRVSVPRGARVYRSRGLDVRQTRRWDTDDLVPAGIPRTRPAVAAVRGALWARSDKQAALLLTMTVQQGLCTAEQLGVEMLRIRRDRRRVMAHQVILDLIGGVRSLGELEFAEECRKRGLPEPTRQVVRRGRNGLYYLDVVWERWGVVVEIDGIHHSWANQQIGDAVRHNDVALKGSIVLRLPLLGMRVEPEVFFEQIEAALTEGGCVLPGAAS